VVTYLNALLCYFACSSTGRCNQGRRPLDSITGSKSLCSKSSKSQCSRTCSAAAASGTAQHSACVHMSVNLFTGSTQDVSCLHPVTILVGMSHLT
jgi:hypothetical protein